VIRVHLLPVLALLVASSTSFAWAQTGYIAFGDSITFGVGDDPLRAEKGYPPRLQALLQAAGINAVVDNFGIGGEDTQMGLARIDNVLRDNALSGDILLLMEGTNDISRNASVESIRFNLNEMAKRAEARGMSVIHATTIPRLPNAKFDPQNITNTTLNQNIRQMAGNRERKLADPYEVFSVTPNLFANYYYLGSDDPVGHPNAAGYDLLAQIFFDVIRNVDRVPPVAGESSPKHGDKGVSPSAPVSVEVWDFGQGIDLSATTLVVNGTATGIVPTGTPKHVTLTYQPATPLSGVVSVGLQSRDLATSPASPNTVSREILSFTVAGTQVLQGDLDQDGRVDGTDLLRFARRFGSRRTDPLYSEIADFNVDGIIDGQDLAVLASNFGKTSF
jgi:lysophospholipase L1-like esterase